LEMQQVQYFLAVCEELNFSRAARRCGVSQPSLSNSISALERELGGALFDRKPSIVLTVLGRMVRPYDTMLGLVTAVSLGVFSIRFGSALRESFNFLPYCIVVITTKRSRQR
jgi:regulatory helix-turn-helix LysR family protein